MADKSGARHNRRDREIITSWHKRADELKSDMAELGAEIQEAAEEAAEAEQGKGFDNALKAVSETEDELRVANYIILFGGRDLEGVASGNKNQDGSRGEFFTAGTDLTSEYTRKNAVMVDWEHATGRGKKMDDIPPGEFLGRVDWKTARKDERGWWVERILNRRLKYVEWLAELIKAGLVGNSSEADAGRVVKGKNGEIKRWPLLRDTLTVSPMEPRMLTANAVTALKALGYLDNDDGGAKPEADATGAESAADAAEHRPADKTTRGVDEMDEKELQAMVAKSVAEALAAKAAADAVEAERQKQEQARIEAAVAAEKARNEIEMDKLKELYAKNGRLPMGQAPVQARFADTRKYDGLTPADMAFMGTLLGAAKTANFPRAQLSDSALKALAIKVAEDKTTAVDMSGQEVSLGEQGRAEMKAIGIEPADVLDAAKANEVNYSTLATGGDEWVGVEYSRRLWPAVRAATFVLQKMPQIEVPQGAESVKIPLESTDPTFYLVAQTTDENSTTKTPNATVPSSKMSTAQQTLTVSKGGGRTQYSGELEEDSLIPWASQLRAQMERALAENLEHLVIDGDTETGATTNINTIGGTPGGTEFYLLANGLRKLGLVTNTANSASIGALSDSSFLTVKNLMGAAGKNAADKQKCDFILDPNVYDQVLQFASLKTQDVYPNATIVDGEINKIWGYPVHKSYFFHWLSTTNPYEANTAGKVNLSNQALNVAGAFLIARWDQWLFGWKRRVTMETVRIPRADITEITALLRVGLTYRDTEAAAIGYNVTL